MDVYHGISIEKLDRRCRYAYRTTGPKITKYENATEDDGSYV